MGERLTYFDQKILIVPILLEATIKPEDLYKKSHLYSRIQSFLPLAWLKLNK